MTTPPTAASTDATGIIVSGPKYAKSIRILEIRRPVRSSNPSSAPSRIEVHADGRPRLSISRVRVYGCAARPGRKHPAPSMIEPLRRQWTSRQTTERPPEPRERRLHGRVIGQVLLLTGIINHVEQLFVSVPFTANVCPGAVG